jgi:hypothetical protein
MGYRDMDEEELDQLPEKPATEGLALTRCPLIERAGLEKRPPVHAAAS